MLPVSAFDTAPSKAMASALRAQTSRDAQAPDDRRAFQPMLEETQQTKPQEKPADRLEKPALSAPQRTNSPLQAYEQIDRDISNDRRSSLDRDAAERRDQTSDTNAWSNREPTQTPLAALNRSRLEPVQGDKAASIPPHMVDEAPSVWAEGGWGETITLALEKADQDVSTPSILQEDGTISAEPRPKAARQPTRKSAQEGLTANQPAEGNITSPTVYGSLILQQEPDAASSLALGEQGEVSDTSLQDGKEAQGSKHIEVQNQQMPQGIIAPIQPPAPDVVSSPDLSSDMPAVLPASAAPATAVPQKDVESVGGTSQPSASPAVEAESMTAASVTFAGFDAGATGKEGKFPEHVQDKPGIVKIPAPEAGGIRSESIGMAASEGDPKAVAKADDIKKVVKGGDSSAAPSLGDHLEIGGDGKVLADAAPSMPDETSDDVATASTATLDSKNLDPAALTKMVKGAPAPASAPEMASMDREGAPVAMPGVASPPVSGSEQKGRGGALPSVPQVGTRTSSSEQAAADVQVDHADTPDGIRGLADVAQSFERILLDKVAHAQQQQQPGHLLRPTPLQMLPIEIGMQAMRGASSFQIRLDPMELGRVDVKLDVNRQGEVSAHLIVERPETLQMLRRDATTLHYAFEQAGLKSSPDGLSFSLRGDGQNGQQQQQQPRHDRPQQDMAEQNMLKAQIEQVSMRRTMVPYSSVDRVI